MIWAGANRGDYDLKYAYALVLGSEAKEEDFNGSWVWKLDTIPRVKTFIWQCLHNSIGVGECLVKWCSSESDICPLCQRELESILHRLRDCETSKQTWERLGIIPSNAFMKGISFLAWKKIARIIPADWVSSPLGKSFFLLLFSCCGSRGMMLFLGISGVIQISIKRSCSVPLSFSIVV